MIVAAALLYGESELEKTIGYAVMGAFDTDCNGATAIQIDTHSSDFICFICFIFKNFTKKLSF